MGMYTGRPYHQRNPETGKMELITPEPKPLFAKPRRRMRFILVEKYANKKAG